MGERIVPVHSVPAAGLESVRASGASMNAEHLHRHAWHAWEDFVQLRLDRDNEELWHSLSHHLRHAVWRSSEEVPVEMRKYTGRDV